MMQICYKSPYLTTCIQLFCTLLFSSIVNMHLCKKQFILIFAFLLFCLVMTVSAKGSKGGGGSGGGGGDLIGGILDIIGIITDDDDDNSASKIDFGQIAYLTIGACIIQQIIIHQV
jgi:hypothetical protein